MKNKKELEKKTEIKCISSIDGIILSCDRKIKRFSCCVMNPPYSIGNRFLEKTLGISDKVITIQPLKWLIAKKQYKKITNIVDNCDVYIDIINGLDNFDAGIIGDCAIQYIDTTKNGKIHIYGNEYNKCEDITPFSKDSYLEEFNKKIDNVKESLWDKIKDTEPYLNRQENNPNDNWWCIKIPKIRGNVKKGNNKESNDFYTIISNNENFIKDGNYGKYKDIVKKPNQRGNYEFLYFAFNTKQELDNFINYIKTDFVRACLMLTKFNANMHRGCLRSVPWFDFSQDIFSKSPREIDDYLFKKYDISDEIRKHIKEILTDYYNIRK